MKAIDTLGKNWQKTKSDNARGRIENKIVKVANSSPLANYENQRNK